MKTFSDLDKQFELFVQELSFDYQEMAYEFKAFCLSRKVQSVYELLQIVGCIESRRMKLPPVQFSIVFYARIKAIQF